MKPRVHPLSAPVVALVLFMRLNRQLLLSLKQILKLSKKWDIVSTPDTKERAVKGINDTLLGP